MTRAELQQHLARIAEDGIDDGVDGRNILRHDAEQRQEIERLKGALKNIAIKMSWDGSACAKDIGQMAAAALHPVPDEERESQP